MCTTRRFGLARTSDREAIDQKDYGQYEAYSA